MKLRFKIALPVFIIFSLIGFVGDSTNSSFNIKYAKETEWVKSNNTNEEDSKCFFHSYYLDVAVQCLNVRPWSDNYLVYFNEKVRVKLISQIKIKHKRDPVRLLMNKSYIPRKSIEEYPFFC